MGETVPISGNAPGKRLAAGALPKKRFISYEDLKVKD